MRKALEDLLCSCLSFRELCSNLCHSYSYRSIKPINEEGPALGSVYCIGFLTTCSKALTQ
jgi:hypothetical protein